MHCLNVMLLDLIVASSFQSSSFVVFLHSTVYLLISLVYFQYSVVLGVYLIQVLFMQINTHNFTQGIRSNENNMI